MDSISVKKTILSKSFSLKKTDQWKDVFILPDLTPKERAANQLLLAELKKRKSTREKNLVIRRGKIVVNTASSETASCEINCPTSVPNSN